MLDVKNTKEKLQKAIIAKSYDETLKAIQHLRNINKITEFEYDYIINILITLK